MVSDSELVNRLREILRTSDLNTTTPAAVRRQLQTDFGEDLTDRKKFISQQIDQILHEGDVNGADEDENVSHPPEDGGDDGGGGEEDGEEATGEDGKEAVEEAEDEDEEEEDDEEDDEEEEKRSKDEETKKKRKGTGFTRLCSLSPQLQEFVGEPEMARTEVVKKLWAYIKEKDLQDPNNRRNIKCDKMLHSIFRVDTINMFQMNKALSKHIWPLESEEDSPIDRRPPVKKQRRQKDEEKSKPKAKQKKGGTTGFLIPLQLSEAFVKFLGTGETTLSRSDAVKRIWDYIKQNQLQDPSDKRRILCDEKLKELFDVDFFNGFSVSKYLTAHLTKVEQ
ncbi:upstream activation factor subunit spp27-like isoform X2 [Chenopodium quinoa]|uniref:upstream activation factor subunit spp27-like isoform X2 n=1 Tax=Chenopodium quinoa TaxID=63459 RepID=UPI000B77B61A|nr:upstream activation factor subunit spp27-like isoform X2 [Chenopodium quinoa]